MLRAGNSMTGYKYGPILLILITFVAEGSDSMRCGNSLVSVGDRKAEILLKCGEPMLRETLAVSENAQNTELVLKYPLLYKHGLLRDQSDVIIDSGSSVTEPIDQWTYYRGRGQFIQYLIFKGGRLIAIENGERM